MRKSLLLLLPSVMVLAGVALADTIYLKNGSVIKGRVASFTDEQFVVVLNTGSDRNLSRAMIYVGDVSRIEFESSPSATVEAPQVVSRDTPVTRDPQPRDTKKEETSTPAETSANRDGETANTNPPPADPPRTTRNKPTGQVRTSSVDVPAKRDWTSTGIIVKRGDTVRISASGSVILDPATGQTSDPDGIENADPKKLMSDKPTGALIAVIGADNDDFIFVGRAVEFSARRDGLLFLSVNEGTLSDNTGVYKATIELQTQQRTTTR